MKKPYKRMKPLLGTFVEVGIEADFSNPSEVANEIFSLIENLQNLLGFHNPTSEISKLNSSAGEEVLLSKTTIRILKLAKIMTEKSESLFNLTVGGHLVRLGILPNHGWKNYLDSGSAGDIEIRGLKAKLKRPVLITLDGIAKGYAVDCAIRLMKKRGVSAGWINAGGDLRVFGNLKLPLTRRNKDNSFTQLGHICNISVATSRVSDINDSRFPGKIVSSRIGLPETGIWTVMAQSAWRADALTKLVPLLSKENRTVMVTKLGGRVL
jgi:thiamine biosynthesis lipoprotein